METYHHDNDDDDTALVNVSAPFVLLASVPLLLVALASYFMDLKLESPIVVGCIRTFVQLSLLGLILTPIFHWGANNVFVVIGYGMFMVLVTTHESVSRSKYVFNGIFGCTFGSLLFNVTLVCLFAFGVIIRPKPVLWEPQYVIPIMGMLLGNSISGSSLSLNSMLVAMVEDSSHEVDLLLSFGANRLEATSRIVREAVRVGAMPMLNTMAVIGLVSIPGMMTGQILGGSPVAEAARYQMLIIYLISMCTFGTILAQVFIIQTMAFDSDMPLMHRFVKRMEKKSFLDLVTHFGATLFRYCCCCCCCCFSCCCNSVNGKREGAPAALGSETQGLLTNSSNGNRGGDVEQQSYMNEHSESAGTNQQRLVIRTLRTTEEPKHFVVSDLSRSVPLVKQENDGKDQRYYGNGSSKSRCLFQNQSFSTGGGEIILIGGPSGVGKSQLLRMIAGLIPLEKDSASMELDGISFTKLWKQQHQLPLWRQRVRYVTQYKVGIPGTPQDFIDRILSLKSWKNCNQTNMFDSKSAWTPPTRDELMSTCCDLLSQWGMDGIDWRNTAWTMLSGGEAQRVIVAISLASRPQVLLMDECTSALDMASKMCVEKSVLAMATNGSNKCKMSVLWITHDAEQAERMSQE